jgi:16S rRNA (adenine1518-N6/adenine1519-N6)-dimethyltransferase
MRQKLGQHFLTDARVIDHIFLTVPLTPHTTVLEIGPGKGALTFRLARHAKEVISVEKDAALARELEETLAREHITNTRVIRGDILKYSPSELKLPDDYIVVANIPYYLTARLIRRLLEDTRPPKSLYLMVQQEVGERMIATPPAMNLLSVGVQAYGTPEILFPVKARSFSPPPEVDSVFLSISNVTDHFFRDCDRDLFFRVVRAAFQGRRKVLLNTLAQGLRVSKAELESQDALRPFLSKRPQELSLSDWRVVAQTVAPFSL